MLKTASELGIHHVVDQLPRITSYDSLEDLEKKLTGLAAEICAHVEAKSETEESSLMDEIVAYIDANFSDYDLSLGTISSKFTISSSYFSRSFKEKIGMNFTQYIWQKRMDEVIRLLFAYYRSVKRYHHACRLPGYTKLHPQIQKRDGLYPRAIP